jgi:hypothetical protein
LPTTSLTLLQSGAGYECLARNRLMLHGAPVAAHVLSLLPAPPAKGQRAFTSK